MIALFNATLLLLGGAFLKAIQAIRKHPFKPLFGFLFIFVTGLVETNSGLFPGFAGGMLLGLALTFIFAGFLALVSLIFDSKKFDLQETVSLTTGIFSPLINSLFILFIAKFLLQPVLMQDDSQLWLRVIFVTLFVLFNPLPEIVARRGVGGVEAFKEALEFMKENGPEWLLAILLMLAPLIIITSPMLVLLMISSNDPLYVWFNLIRTAVSLFASLAGFFSERFAYPAQFLLMAAGLYYVFFIFLFRFALFESLNKTTRRKRIYAASTK